MAYTKQTWQDEQLDGAPKYAITGALTNADIEMITPVTQMGTPFVAARFGHMEDGIEEAGIAIEDFGNWAHRRGQTVETVFNADGSIVQTAADATLTTVFNADGSITAELHIASLDITVRKTTSFNADGSIREVIS